MKTKPLLLGVNIDHVATLRQARLTSYPDPVQAALDAGKAGADSITLHLREDRRHIQDQDVRALKDILDIPMNLEMAMTDEMIAFTEAVKPEYCCVVPEKREELTTEGGLDITAQQARTAECCHRLHAAGIRVSLFINADMEQIAAAREAGAGVIEIHTGHYADAVDEQSRQVELRKIISGIETAKALGLQVNAGHGLNYDNVQAIARLEDIHELNIGHSIVARAVFTGMFAAVKEMKNLMQGARS